MTDDNYQSQEQEVLDYLYKHGSITPWDAIERGITRLSAKIFELRKKGYNIKTQKVTEKNRHGRSTTFARYIFVGEK